MSAFWDDCLIERMKVLYAEGHSFAQIAKRLGGGVSRNAVLGKVRRLKLPPRVATASARRTWKKEAKAPRPPKLAVAVSTKPTAPADVTEFTPAPESFLCAPQTFAVGSTCRFIHGDVPGNWQMCGRPVAKAGSSWCDAHAAKIYNPRATEASKKSAELSAQTDAAARRVGLG